MKLIRLFGGVDVSALKAQVASLSLENRRLADQVRTLTAAVERSQQNVSPSTPIPTASLGRVPNQDSEQAYQTTIETKDPDGRVAYFANVTLRDGTELPACRVWNYNPGGYGGGGHNEKAIGVCTTLEVAADYNTNRARQLSFQQIARILVSAFTDAEMESVNRFMSYDQAKILKCEVVFHNGYAMACVYLMPHYFRYATTIEQGEITRSTVRAIRFIAS